MLPDRRCERIQDGEFIHVRWHLAESLHSGGAYGQERDDGRTAKRLALDFCEVAFGLRFAEVLYYAGHTAWTRWFFGIAWDWTAVLFDRRLRNLCGY
jgi:hypothetical protein